MALEVIRQKLDWNSSDHYTEIIQLITDLRLMFRNAYNYNEVGFYSLIASTINKVSIENSIFTLPLLFHSSKISYQY